MWERRLKSRYGGYLEHYPNLKEILYAITIWREINYNLAQQTHAYEKLPEPTDKRSLNLFMNTLPSKTVY
ncbi:hypothetical protein [Bacillus sp. UNCCL81]|uniref:hypothetical protein n=1 Tax=Bacillus sp. UNCCL81 TaxID=1502755 RepID=UPI000B88B534|nr:hypothetical protein [Bacillus sp. UNCCL81]